MIHETELNVHVKNRYKFGSNCLCEALNVQHKNVFDRLKEHKLGRLGMAPPPHPRCRWLAHGCDLSPTNLTPEQMRPVNVKDFQLQKIYSFTSNQQLLTTIK